MNGGLLRLVLLVSCAHALVHVYEQSLPSVEQPIADDFEVGPGTTGKLGTAWRLPFGLGAMLAGLLADRFGSKRMLVVYLMGCSGMALWAYFAPSLESLFAGMFVMGCFASIYHPAGLALIAHETTPATRGAALGWHGIFGSLGIAAAPFMAALVFSTTSVTWRDYYLVLAAPGVVLAACLAWRMPLGAGSARQSAAPEAADSSRWRLRALCTLVAAGILSGIIYSAFTHFLPRYLDGAGLRPEGATAASFRTTLTALVLVCGAFGQALAGRLCRPDRLGWLLPLVLLAQVPCLAWMALAQGQARLWSTCAVAFVHFMQQPVYNSLIPRFVPARKLSLAFGFSNMMCFGLGAFGPTLAGMLWQQGSAGEAERWTYGLLAVVALASTAAAGAATGFSRQTERT